jgi:peptide/nickel transport system substrate-binding protein
MSVWLWRCVCLVVVLSLITGCSPAAPTPSATTKDAATVPSAVAATKPPSGAAPAPAATTAVAPTPTVVSKVKRGGALTMARATTEADMDPHRSLSVGATIGMLYESLMDYRLVDTKTGKHDLAPMLAETWKVSDLKTVEITLRKGIKFHDGSDFNAEAVKWNLDRVRTDSKSSGKAVVSEIESVEVVDASTARIKLKVPWAPVLVNLSASGGGPGGRATLIASKSAVEKGGDTILSEKPAGTGPMVIEQWLRDDRVVMRKWDGHWRKGVDGQPLPYLDTFTVRVIPDPSIQLVELKAGSIQLAEEIDAKDIASIKANPDLVYYEMPWASVTFFTFGFNQYRLPFKDNRKLAQAAQYAVDRENMAKTMGFGMANPAYYLFWIPSLLGYNEQIPKYSFDPSKSKQLLAEAGYPNGVEMNLITSSRGVDPRLAEIAKFMWDSAGIRTTVDILDRLAAIDRAKAKNFDVYFWRSSPNPDIDGQSARIVCEGATNWSNYCNPEIDKCMAEGRSVYGEKERQSIYERCLRILQEDALIGSGYLLPANKVYHKSVKGLNTAWFDVDVREVWLDK